MPLRVHSMRFRNHIWPGSAGGLACYPPSCSSAPTHVPLPVREESQVKLLVNINVIQLILKNTVSWPNLFLLNFKCYNFQRPVASMGSVNSMEV